MTAHNVHTLSNTEATRITPLGTHSGMDITIQNIETSGLVYIGGEGVTQSDFGYKLSPGHAVSFELPGRDPLYVIAQNSGAKISTLQISLEQQD